MNKWVPNLAEIDEWSKCAELLGFPNEISCMISGYLGKYVCTSCGDRHETWKASFHCLMRKCARESQEIMNKDAIDALVRIHRFQEERRVNI